MLLSLGLALAFLPGQESAARTPAPPRGPNTTAPKPSCQPVEQKKWGQLEGYAAWYVVPPGSLARRRAGQNELTAAHNHLPLGTMVRVTHLANGRTVLVRITDRGITNRHLLIDLCKEAADKLGMLREGSARVRLEILSQDKAAATLGVSPAIATHR